MSRLQSYIQEGTKCFVKTRHSNMELLCTVVMLDNYNVKVKLPCPVNGKTHDVVNIKDIRVLPPEPEAKAIPASPYMPAKPNPFRKLVEALQPIDEPEQAEPIAPPPKDKVPIVSDGYTGISQDEIDFMDGLSPAERKAYMDLLK